MNKKELLKAERKFLRLRDKAFNTNFTFEYAQLVWHNVWTGAFKKAFKHYKKKRY